MVEGGLIYFIIQCISFSVHLPQTIFSSNFLIC